jgi:two-component system response regulator HydG
VLGLSLTALPDAAGAIAGRLWCSATSRRSSAAASASACRSGLAALGEMAAGLAHELRNPLAGMEVIAGLLQRRLRDDPDGLSLVVDLRSQLRQLSATVTSSLEFLRPVALCREPIDPIEVVEEALVLALARAPRPARVERRYATPLARLEADRQLLGVALVNLIVNACEAMAETRCARSRLDVGLEIGAAPELTRAVRVDRDVRADDGMALRELRIAIGDTGPGIADDIRDRIFDPFFTTRASGSGIGLANVQKIVHAHGGTLSLQSSEAGSVFRVHLPAAGGGAVGVDEARILVVEDQAALRRGMAMALREAWGHADEEATGDAAVTRLADPHREPYDVVVTDLRLPGADGIAVLEAARERDLRTRVLVLTGVRQRRHGRARDARGRVRLPRESRSTSSSSELRVARALEHRRLLAEVGDLRAERAERRLPGAIVAESPAMREAVELARLVAPRRSTVLITGETGTGKELFAGLIHESSPRAAGPLVKVNCAALPETLLESELFGHERGSFTGADRRRIGRFEEASGGTLFLDEVGELSPAIQAKLLRVLQDQEFHRVGRHPDAAHRRAARRGDQRRSRARGTARRVPRRPLLSPRRDPHPPAAAARAARGRGRARAPIPGRAGGQRGPRTASSPTPIARLRAHRWPGNVRELRNAIERSQLFAAGPRLRASDLALATPTAPPIPASGAPSCPRPGGACATGSAR